MSTKPHKNSHFSLFIVMSMIVITVLIVLKNNEWDVIWKTLLSLDGRWLWAAFMLWFGSAVVDALILQRLLKQNGYPIRTPFAVCVSIVGSFYSAITPGASGGQPMQIYYLNQKKIPVGISSSAITVRFVLSQTAIVIVTLFLWAGNSELINTQLAGYQWLILIGWLVHFAGVALILLATYCQSFLQRLAGVIILIGQKTRILRNPESTRDKLNEWIASYRQSFLATRQHPSQVVLLTLLSAVSLLMTMAIVICIYQAFGLCEERWYDLLTIAYMLYLSASYNPLPGASGAQEGGFLMYYQGIFPKGQISLAMLVWRFFTYYLYLLAGALLSAAQSIAKFVHARCKRSG